MPRIKELKNEYLQKDLTAWLWSQIKTQDISQGKVAERLGIAQETLSRKMKRNSYSFKDFLIFIELFQPDTETINRLLGTKGEKHEI